MDSFRDPSWETIRWAARGEVLGRRRVPQDFWACQGIERGIAGEESFRSRQANRLRSIGAVAAHSRSIGNTRTWVQGIAHEAFGVASGPDLVARIGLAGFRDSV